MPSIQKVIAVLKKAGFTCSKTYASGRVRGSSHTHAGFEARNSWSPKGEITVEHLFGDWAAKNTTEEMRQDWINKYRDALRLAGIACEVRTEGSGIWTRPVVVVPPTPHQAELLTPAAAPSAPEPAPA